MESFISAMKNRLEVLGMSTTELAKACGKSRVSIFNILRGKQNPSLTLAVNIAKNLGLSIDKCFGLASESSEDVETKEDAVSKVV